MVDEVREIKGTESPVKRIRSSDFKFEVPWK